MEEKRQFSDKFMLRLPDGLRDRIKAAAEANNRSMNAEIVGTLEEKYPAPKAPSDFHPGQLLAWVLKSPDEATMIERAHEANLALEAAGIELMIRVLDEIGAKVMKNKAVLVGPSKYPKRPD